MMSASATVRSLGVPAQGLEDLDRYEGIQQYSRWTLVWIWVAATAPMAIAAWVLAPWLSHYVGTSEPLGLAMLILYNAGLLWILVLTLFLVRRERGGLGWAELRDALWLRSPQDPKTNRVGGKVWWWIVPFTLFGAGLELLRIDPKGPMPRDFKNFIGTDRANHFFQGAWGVFALTMLLVFLSPIVEELFFRGLLLPRMRAVCGRWDWIVNGVIFTGFHLHEPWVMPSTFLDSTFTAAYPAKRFRSIWIGMITHTVPSFAMIGIFLPLVLK